MGSLSHPFAHCAPGDLGSIDAKYDIAVSSCTGMLDHIVVDSMSTAQVSCAAACSEALLCTPDVRQGQQHLPYAASAGISVAFSARQCATLHIC